MQKYLYSKVSHLDGKSEQYHSASPGFLYWTSSEGRVKVYRDLYQYNVTITAGDYDDFGTLENEIKLR